ncbi:MAG: hypothetical protein ABIZ05_06995 [Pseudonocardiaceae bacterium]
MTTGFSSVMRRHGRAPEHVVELDEHGFAHRADFGADVGAGRPVAVAEVDGLQPVGAGDPQKGLATKKSRTWSVSRRRAM